MSGNKTLVSVLILIGLAGFIRAQEGPGPEPNFPENPISSIKIDEFGAVGHCDFGARIDNLYIQLQNNAGATAYIITYKSAKALPGEWESDRMASRAREHFRMRGVDQSRVVFLDGGFRTDIGTELFIVPPGAAAPEPTNTVQKPKAPKGTFLWSSNTIGTEKDFEGNSLEEFVLPDVANRRAEEQRLQEAEMEAELAEQEVVKAENMEDELQLEPGEGQEVDQEDVAEAEREQEMSAEALREARFSWIDRQYVDQIMSRKGSRGVIIFYADDQEFDINKLRAFVEEGRDKIAHEAKMKADVIEIVFGGYRHYPEAQFYVVAKGAMTPVPEPDERVLQEEEQAEPSQDHDAPSILVERS